MVGGGKDREEMSKLINIDDERFWDILFDEACVEGKQAERIKTELEKIVAFDTEKVIEQLEEMKNNKDCQVYCYEFYKKKCMIHEDAIDIVKKGGVE